MLSAFVYFPVAFTVVSKLQEAVLGIMPFAAIWAFQIPAPTGALAIILLRDGKSCPTAARDKKHLQFMVLGHRDTLSIKGKGQAPATNRTLTRHI